MQELDANSDATMGNVQNGIHRALFGMNGGCCKFPFKYLPRKLDKQKCRKIPKRKKNLKGESLKFKDDQITVQHMYSISIYLNSSAEKKTNTD